MSEKTSPHALTAVEEDDIKCCIGGDSPQSTEQGTSTAATGDVGHKHGPHDHRECPVDHHSHGQEHQGQQTSGGCTAQGRKSSQHGHHSPSDKACSSAQGSYSDQIGTCKESNASDQERKSSHHHSHGCHTDQGDLEYRSDKEGRRSSEMKHHGHHCKDQEGRPSDSKHQGDSDGRKESLTKQHSHHSDHEDRKTSDTKQPGHPSHQDGRRTSHHKSDTERRKSRSGTQSDQEKRRPSRTSQESKYGRKVSGTSHHGDHDCRTSSISEYPEKGRRTSSIANAESGLGHTAGMGKSKDKPRQGDFHNDGWDKLNAL